MKRLCDKLGGYRVEEHIGWTERVEAWLSNFEGLEDQELALSMVERLRVVSHNEVIHGCKALYDRIKAASPSDDARLHHFAHETSGAALLRSSRSRQARPRRTPPMRPGRSSRSRTTRRTTSRSSSALVRRIHGSPCSTGMTQPRHEHRHPGKIALVAWLGANGSAATFEGWRPVLAHLLTLV